MNITIKLSGHVLFPTIDSSTNLKDYAKTIKELVSRNNRIYVVVGGGAPARYYIRMARSEGADEATCDQVGIIVANLNAKIFSQSLGEFACPFVPLNFNELEMAMATGKVIVMGGLQPGQSTNAVACILAEKTRSDLLINTTTIDGVYSSDPRKDQNAKLLENITVEELGKILEPLGAKAGEYALLDHVALRIIKRSKIITKIIDGRDPLNILRASEGKNVGTTIIP